MFRDWLLVWFGAVIGGTFILGVQLAVLAYREGRRRARFADVDALVHGGHR